jgi:hypothetical protein
MATHDHGMVSSYDNTVPQKRMITDRIILADPYDITCITALGLNGPSAVQFVNKPNRAYEWLEDTYTSTATTINEADVYSTAATTTVTVADGTFFHVGDVCQIDDELIWVTSISGNDLTVVRSYGATTNVTHLTTAAIYIRYNARMEGADDSESPWTEISSQINYSMIMHASVSISESDKMFPNYGVANLLEYNIDKNMDKLLEQLNRAPYYAHTPVVGANATTTGGRSFGGFHNFITTNASALSGATLLRKHIDDEFMQIFAAGGKTNLILCDAWFQKKINDFYEGFVSTERSESIGGMMIKKLMHPITGSLVDVVVDRHCQSGYAYLLQKEYVGYITIRPFFYEQLAKTGDSEQGQTIGEYGFVNAANKFHSIISGYSTTA